MKITSGKKLATRWVWRWPDGSIGEYLYLDEPACRAEYGRELGKPIQVALVKQLEKPKKPVSDSNWLGRWENCRLWETGDLARFEWTGPHDISVRMQSDPDRVIPYTPSRFGKLFIPLTENP